MYNLIKWIDFLPHNQYWLVKIFMLYKFTLREGSLLDFMSIISSWNNHLADKTITIYY